MLFVQATLHALVMALAELGISALVIRIGKASIAQSEPAPTAKHGQTSKIPQSLGELNITILSAVAKESAIVIVGSAIVSMGTKAMDVDA